MDGELVNQVIQNTKNIKAMMNQRRSTIVRKYGEEHDAGFVGNTATFYLPVDTDMEYISELQVKVVLGSMGTGGTIAAGTYVNAVKGINTYANYSAWISAYPIGAAVDCDGSFGCQCWDYACAFWYAQCNRQLQTGSHHSAADCWNESRTANAGSEFDLITDKTQIQQGDWLVFGGGSYGHIAMAAENYSNGINILCYGQNQGGTPMPKGGAAVNLTSLYLGNFIGGFRYKRWHS